MPKLTKHYQTVLSRFLSFTDRSNAQVRDIVAHDYDGRIIHVNANDRQYYLIETDHIETDTTYQRIARAKGHAIIRKVPLKNEFIPAYPQKTLGMQHDFVDMRNEWEYVYEDKTSSWLYCLYEVSKGV